ncbi:exopolysaccharide production repressor protein [Foliimonas ilicis]
MPFLLFLRGFLAVLLAFALVTFIVTQSVWTTFIQTLICAVLLQVGYFIAVLFLVWRSGHKDTASSEDAAASKNSVDSAQTSTNVGRLPKIPRSGHT